MFRVDLYGRLILRGPSARRACDAAAIYVEAILAMRVLVAGDSPIVRHAIADLLRAAVRPPRVDPVSPRLHFPAVGKLLPFSILYW
jgi:hypothetical protein